MGGVWKNGDIPHSMFDTDELNISACQVCLTSDMTRVLLRCVGRRCLTKSLILYN